MIRATTGGVLRSYRKNLMGSFIANSKARDTVLSQRTFNSYAEDPAAAAKAFRLRKSRMMVNSQHDVCQDTYSKFQVGFSSLLTIDELIDTSNGKGTAMTTLKGTSQEMLNDPKGDARTQLAKVLDQLGESIIQNMNQKYGDEFVFAGADGHNVPFEVKEVDGHKKLYYRGVPVDAAEPNVMKFNQGGGVVEAAPMLAPDGTIGHGATHTLYLKMDNLTQMPLTEYEKLYTLPDVEPKDSSDPNAQGFEEYNEDGTLFTGKEGEEGGYYRKTNGATTFPLAKPADPSDLITKDDYYATVERINSAPELLKWDNTNLGPSLEGRPVLFTQTNGAYGMLNSHSVGDVIPDKENYYVMFVNGDPKDQGMTQEEYDAAKLDADKLEYLTNEKRFVDIGLGFQEGEDGKLIESSAFDDALVGLRFLGCGLDEDGDPKNIYSIVQRLKEISEGVPEEGKWDDATYEEFKGLVQKLEAASSEFKTQFTNMDAGTQKLKYNVDLLEDNFDTLQTQYSNLEDVNMAEAITSFIWAEYCYNAALKVGNSILSQSLMDYLN